MTVQELLRDCDFDRIAPYLCSLSDEYETDPALHHYKELFDRFRHTGPAYSDERIYVLRRTRDGLPKFNGSDGNAGEAHAPDTYISVENCEEDYFDANLGKELVVSADIRISREELASRVLWSMTCYGFTDEEQEIALDGVPSRYSIYDDYVADIESQAESFIQLLTASPTEPRFRRDDLQFLFACEEIDWDEFHSYAFDAKARIRYIEDLVTEYPDSRNPIYHSKYRGLLVYVTTSVAHPMGKDEWSELLWLADRIFQPGTEVRCGAGIDDRLDKDIIVRFICYR